MFFKGKEQKKKFIHQNANEDTWTKQKRERVGVCSLGQVYITSLLTCEILAAHVPGGGSGLLSPDVVISSFVSSSSMLVSFGVMFSSSLVSKGYDGSSPKVRCASSGSPLL